MPGRHGIVDEHINLFHTQRLEAFVRGPDRHVLRMPQMALDVCACGHELSRPKHVSWLPAYGVVGATSIPVACQHTNTCQLHVIIICRWDPWRSPLGSRS